MLNTTDAARILRSISSSSEMGSMRAAALSSLPAHSRLSRALHNAAL
jgi:hypothetical protein